MIVLGIDPSLETGLAIVEITNQVRWITGTCIKPGKAIDTTDRIRWIADTAIEWRKGTRTRPELIAIEYPAVGRRNASPLQWRLIGHIEHAFSAWPQVAVTPGQAKQAVGLSYHSQRKPIDEVRTLLGLDHDIADTRYAREAVSDAVATAIAGHRKFTAESDTLSGAQEGTSQRSKGPLVG